MKKKYFLLVSIILLLIISSCKKQDDKKEEDNSDIKTHYVVNFYNYDGSLLYSIEVIENEEAEYRGERPEKPSDDEFIYEFNGWSADISAINSDLDVYAKYKENAIIDWTNDIFN